MEHKKKNNETPFNILIIDDDRMMLKLYEHTLQGPNIEIITAENGVEGLEKARTIKPDLILLDIMMPIKSGVEVLQELRTDSELQKIPVIVFSILSQQNDIEEMMKLGAIRYFSKENYSAKEITEEVRKVMDRKIG